MAVTKIAPRTILLGGSDGAPATIINDLQCGVAFTPGHLVERYQFSAGVYKWRKHSTAAGAGSRSVALNQSMLNRGVDTAYAATELAEVGALKSGDTAWMFIASGATAVTGGAKLESAGDGTLRLLAAGVALFLALEDVDNSAGAVGVPGRIRVEAL